MYKKIFNIAVNQKGGEDGKNPIKTIIIIQIYKYLQIL